jgi:hypothetical protein
VSQNRAAVQIGRNHDNLRFFDQALRLNRARHAKCVDSAVFGTMAEPATAASSRTPFSSIFALQTRRRHGKTPEERKQVKGGRKAGLSNGGFGTVFGVVDSQPLPVCDYAGFAPFDFAHRRCPGKQLTIPGFEDFLHKV